MSEKLQKVLARAGLGSRRQMEGWIKAGRILVNNKSAKLGDRVEDRDRISVDGKVITQSTRHSVQTKILIYNKPRGEICTRSDPEGRRTVFARLPPLMVGRWVAVGRLDINSEGLLLFTNDGELANALMHPKRALEREYLVRVLGEVTPEIIAKLQLGIKLEDGEANFKTVQKTRRRDGANQWFKVVVTEGRNKLVRRLWNAQEIAVNRLIRIRFNDIILPSSLPPGRVQELGVESVKRMLRNFKEDTKKENRNGNRKKDIGR